MMMCRRPIVFSFLFVVNVSTFLFDKEELFLVPSVAFRDRSSTSNWLVENQGWYYEENPVKALVMEKSLETIVQRDLDRQRVKMFTAEGKENKKVCIDGLTRSICTQTDGEGRLKTQFQLTNNDVENLRENDDKLVYKMSVPFKRVKSIGEIHLCDDDGVTFISDIDDTIKITGVTSSTQTLINTFTGEFKAVPEMSQIYRHWKNQTNGTFAYLTASPDQLYPFLRQFFDRELFPQGSAHMRHFTWFDLNFISFFMSSNYVEKKLNTLKMFFEKTQRRRFVLLGDIFQKDPEIYAEIASKYADRIVKIFIRKYVDDLDGQIRLENLFKDFPRSKWSTFETGGDLPRNIFA